MIKSNLALAACALALVACATPEKADAPRVIGKSITDVELMTEEGFNPELVKAPENCVVNVFVDAYDQITVDHEPVSTKDCGTSVKKIRWKLDRSGGVFTFPATGAVSFKGSPLPQNVDCRASTNRRVYICEFDRSSSAQRYQYSITVLKNGVALPPLDPTVFNN